MSFLGDVRYAFRSLVRTPGFTIAAVLTLALGIGANTAIFSVINGVLLRPLPFPESDRLVKIWQTAPGLGYPQFWFSEPEFFDYRERQGSFEAIAVFRLNGANLTGSDAPIRVGVAMVSADFFPILQTDAALGRTFAAQEDMPGVGKVAVLSDDLWRSGFAGDPGIVGGDVVLDGEPLTVLGVMPKGFAYPQGQVDIWTPIALDRANLDIRQRHVLEVIGRIRPGVILEEATADVDRIALQLKQEYPQAYTETMGFGAFVVPIRESIVGGVRSTLLILLGAVGLVLMIACSNVANLMLARASAREKEIAIRASMGAGRWRLVRLLLAEILLLALAGGGLGLLGAAWGTNALVALSPESIPRIAQVGVDGHVLAFTLIVSLLAGLLFGLAPALHVSTPDLHGSLKEGGRTSSAPGRRSLRNGLVISQVGLSVILLIGAGLLSRSFLRVLEVDLGFQTENILTFVLSPPAASYPEEHHLRSFYDELLQRIGSLPGVEAAGCNTTLPLSGALSSTTILVEDLPPASPTADYPHGAATMDFLLVSPGYIEAMELPLLEGRLFDWTDRHGSPLVAIIDEDLASGAWPTEETALGKRVAMPLGPNEELKWHTVVGVVRHAKHRGPDVEGRVQVYLPISQFLPRHVLSGNMYFALRSRSDPRDLLGAVRSVVSSLDPGLPLYNVRTMEQRLDSSVGSRRFVLELLSLFAVVALALAGVGVYSVIAYSVTQRTHELGVRMALGARPVDIVKMVIGWGIVPTLVGIGVGIVAALGLMRLLSSLLFGVTPTDPASFVLACLFLLALGLLSAYVPARRAVHGDLLAALRCE
jgi:putative ABC transport system permease protein